MNRVLEGLEDVVCQIDDILVYGPQQEAHDFRLDAVLERLEKAGVTLNREKCSFCQPQLKFFGHGVSADPDKTAAVLNMAAPTNVSELRRFLGMTNQLGKFLPTWPTSPNPGESYTAALMVVGSRSGESLSPSQGRADQAYHPSPL